MWNLQKSFWDTDTVQRRCRAWTKARENAGISHFECRMEARKSSPPVWRYACRVKMDGTWYCGIGNLGIKPTVTDAKRILTEVYVFDYKGDAYGKYVEIEFCAFERPESRFASLEELKTQVDRDILFGMEYFRAQQ